MNCFHLPEGLFYFSTQTVHSHSTVVSRVHKKANKTFISINTTKSCCKLGLVVHVLLSNGKGEFNLMLCHHRPLNEQHWTIEGWTYIYIYIFFTLLYCCFNFAFHSSSAELTCISGSTLHFHCSLNWINKHRMRECTYKADLCSTTAALTLLPLNGCFNARVSNSEPVGQIRPVTSFYAAHQSFTCV